MHVAQCDMDREHKQLMHSLEKQVVKVASLLANRRGLSSEAWDANAIRARAGNQKVARMIGIQHTGACFNVFVCLHFLLIGSTFAGARAQSCPGCHTKGNG
jgi:hypothetical protein